MKKRKTIRWGLVGLGAQGGRMASALRSSKKVLVAVGSEDTAHGRAFARRFSARSTNFSDLARDNAIDAICISSRNFEHAEQAVKALRAGKAVFCEKPLALTVADGERIRNAARRAKKYCAVNFHLRMHPAIQETRKMVQQNVLGDLRFIEMHWSIGSWGESLRTLAAHEQWREDPAQAGGGALMARGVHLFDLLRFLTGQEVRAVEAYADGEIDRTTAGFAYLTGGIVASVITSKVLPGAENRIALYGSKGSLVLTDTFLSDSRARLVHTSVYSKKTSYKKAGNLYAAALKEFEKGKRGVLADVSDGLSVVRITKAWQRSARQDKRITVR